MTYAPSQAVLRCTAPNRGLPMRQTKPNKFPGKPFAAAVTILRIGVWEIMLMPHPYEVITSAKWLAIHRLGRYICVFLGPRALIIRHCS
jgi:hypothetical protein